MDEMEFDRTRKAIGSEQIAEEERRRLLSTFTSAGGKVLDEKALRRQQEEARRKAAGGGAEEDRGRSGDSARLPSEIKREQRQRELERQALDRKRKEIMMREASGFFAGMMVKLRCYVAGLTPFSRGVVLPSALTFLSLDLRRALIECNIIGNELLVNEPEVARALRKELKNPLLIELINRARQLYDRSELSELLAAYNESNPRPIPIESMRVPLLSLLRKLYALMPYKEAYLKSVYAGIIVQQRIQKKSPDLYQAKMKAIESAWRLLMDRALPKIVLLVQRLEMKNIAPGHLLFEEWIGFGPDLRLTANPQSLEPEVEAQGGSGANASLEPSAGTGDSVDGMDLEESSEETAREKKKEELARRLFDYGLGLHKLKTPDQLRALYDDKGEYALSDIRDKAFLSYLLLNLFDDQFAFILTTNRMQLQSALQGGIRVNLKQDMTDVYQTIRNCYDLYRAYYHDYVEYRRALEDAMRPGNYVEGARKVAMHESRRGRTGREVRVAIKNYMNRVEKILTLLLKDMKEGGRVVMNPDDIIVMDLESDREKVMNGKKVKIVIRDAYAFAHALGRRLDSGDLFGGVLEMSEEDFRSAFGIIPSQGGPVQQSVGGVHAETPVDFADSFADFSNPESPPREIRTTPKSDDIF